MTASILLTGPTGFLGRAVLDSLLDSQARPRIRLIVHRRDPEVDADGSVERFAADLADPRSLVGACGGVDTLLHLAAYVGDDAVRCETVNGRGTEALVAVARTANVRRILYLSSAAVYGYAIHRGASEDEVRVAPATAVSRSRVRAERAVLRAGGVVLRPLFVYGPGDERFLPAIIRGLRRVPFWIDQGRARLSVISVEDLGQIITHLTERPAPWPAGVYHATDGHPVSFREIATELSRCLGLRSPTWSLPYPVARWVVRLAFAAALGGDRWDESSAHRLFLVSRDHYYDASRLWRLVPFKPGPPLRDRLPDYMDWYRRFVPGRTPPERTPS